MENPKHKVFCFHDSKSATYGPPITTVTKGVFIREVQQALAQEQKPLWGKHPQDFSIFEIGEYDPSSGVITPHDTKNCLGLVQDFQN